MHHEPNRDDELIASFLEHLHRKLLLIAAPLHLRAWRPVFLFSAGEPFSQKLKAVLLPLGSLGSCLRTVHEIVHAAGCDSAKPMLVPHIALLTTWKFANIATLSFSATGFRWLLKTSSRD